MYIDWLEEALADAIATRWNDARRLCVYRHDIEYARSAVPGDVVMIDVRLIGVGKTASAWNLEIKRGDELLVRDHITALWVDQTGKPVRW
jgi:acyl-CoA thioesterase FadM